jgi:hypothetical protein
MKEPTTKTSSVLDTHESIILELTAHGICAPPQGKFIRLSNHQEPDGDETEIAKGGIDEDESRADNQSADIEWNQ